MASVTRCKGHGRLAAVLAQVEALEDIQHLAEHDAARRRRPDAKDFGPAKRRVDRRAQLGLVGLQVVQADEASLSRSCSGRSARRFGRCRTHRRPCSAIRSRHSARSRWISRSPGFQGVWSGLPNAAIDSGKSPSRPKSSRAVVGLVPARAASWRLSERASSAEIGKPSRASRAAGRTSSAQAVLPNRACASPKPADRARHAGRPGTGAVPRARLSVGPQIHRRRGRARCHLAEVDRHDLAPVAR